MIHVYTGPTLSSDDSALADARFTPKRPIKHGDLFARDIGPGDTVVIIDGLYHQTPAIRHKEIIWAMQQGIRVVGAASIGALRAAELASCGMVGVGAIFRAYTSGEIEGDDEVAVGQSADEDARSYSWPLVNVRHVLGLGVEARVINEQAAEILLRELRTVYYAHRSLTAVTAYGRNCGANEFVSWLKNRLANDEHFGNLKRADALLALETALQFDGTPGEPKAGLEWQTRCFRQWANAFAEEIVDGTTLATRHRVAYQQIFDPDFKVVWWKHLREAGVSSGLPHLLACVAYRSEVDLTNWETTALLLSRETPADRQAVAQHGALNEDAVHSNPGFFPEAIKDDVSRQLLTKIWRLSEDGLENEAWARGFQGARDAVETMKLFTLGHMCERKAVQ